MIFKSKISQKCASSVKAMQFAQKIANQIIFLDNGKIAESALPQDFFTNPQSSKAKRFLNIFG